MFLLSVGVQVHTALQPRRLTRLLHRHAYLKSQISFSLFLYGPFQRKSFKVRGDIPVLHFLEM
jgi:hypothetical protein